MQGHLYSLKRDVPYCQFVATPISVNVPNLSALLCAIPGHLDPVTTAVEELDKQVVETPFEHETTCIHKRHTRLSSN